MTFEQQVRFQEMMRVQGEIQWAFELIANAQSQNIQLRKVWFEDGRFNCTIFNSFLE